MATALWIIVGILALGTVVGGLMRMRAWLRKPAPPEIIEAAARRREEEEND